MSEPTVTDPHPTVTEPALSGPAVTGPDPATADGAGLGLTDPADTGRRAAALRAVENELQRLIHRVRRQMAESAERLSPGLQPVAFKTFAAIARHAPVSSSALAERLGVDKGLLSRTVTQLGELGLVRRDPDPADGRIGLLSPTPEGVQRLADVRRPDGDPLALATTAWDDGDLETFAVLLHALAERSAPGSFDALEAPGT